jgi:glycerol uptake facilitator protein
MPKEIVDKLKNWNKAVGRAGNWVENNYLEKQNMTPFVAEIIGTMLLILLGNGVVANVVLKKTKGNSSGWIVITAGWAFAVFVAVTVAGPISGAHINPAVTIGLAIAGKFAWNQVAYYIVAQMIELC